MKPILSCQMISVETITIIFALLTDSIKGYDLHSRWNPPLYLHSVDYQLSKIEWPYHNSHRLGNALCPLIHRHCTQLSQFSSVCGSPKEDRNHVYIFSESSTMHFKWFNSNYSPYNPFQESLLNTALDCRTFTRFHTRNHVLLIYFTSDILV